MQEKKLDGNTYCRLLRGGYRKLREHAAPNCPGAQQHAPADPLGGLPQRKIFRPPDGLDPAGEFDQKQT